VRARLNNPSSALDTIRTERVIAILRAPDASRFHGVAEALFEGGIRVLEFTLTTVGALEALRWCAVRLPGAVLGAGSVRNAESAAAAAEAGATFLVAPTVATDVIDAGRGLCVPVVAGGFTPTELVQALEAGASAVKLFPAYLGGPKYLRAILEPLPHLPIIPTGGITLSDAPHYLAAGAFAVGLGSQLIGRATSHLELASVRELSAALIKTIRPIEAGGGEAA